MKTTHSLIRPSSFERRKLCPGSLNAEKDLPNVTSKYSEIGTMLHDRTNRYITKGDSDNWKEGLTTAQIEAVEKSGNYFFKLLQSIKGEYKVFHEQSFDLSFIHPEMKKGTVDSLILNDKEVHVIDYKFGHRFRVYAQDNYQLLLYYLGAIYNKENIAFLQNKDYVIYLHIVAPFMNNSVWCLTESEKEFYSDISIYREIAEKCYIENAPRIASKKGCQFCKAKATCPALANTVPEIRKPVDFLFDSDIAKIYENKELISLYLKSVEEYIKNRLESGSFLDYRLQPKLGNRKWADDAESYLSDSLGNDAFEVTKKLIGITKAEKLIGKELVNQLTTKEEVDVEIIKLSTISKNIFKNFNNN